ncbi:hypothetical protein R69749_07473 [Paraburkholderia domus]|uniref:Uncharacterized protein n=1 Tax=Paraburkholderia domus TaxID=2793075 RepID=A0A9N8N8I4_9BURK|nr:hypothetical protein R70006_08116 [Paraburkholderia domus]CAE6888629.1 hypothetical protein R69749_07473 [Paraburkholderia domus]CAE6964260.1 hypothetical protein R70211_07209 [Paraburkholderia domus]CAE6967169.1 hypothetical protein R70199_07818 [Paraburkholderia domus]
MSTTDVVTFFICLRLTRRRVSDKRISLRSDSSRVRLSTWRLTHLCNG